MTLYNDYIYEYRYHTNYDNLITLDKKMSPALISQRLKQECAKRNISCTPCDIRNWTQIVQKNGSVSL